MVSTELGERREHGPGKIPLNVGTDLDKGADAGILSPLSVSVSHSHNDSLICFPSVGLTACPFLTPPPPVIFNLKDILFYHKSQDTSWQLVYIFPIALHM